MLGNTCPLFPNTQSSLGKCGFVWCVVRRWIGKCCLRLFWNTNRFDYVELRSCHLVENSEFQKCLISRLTNQLQKQIQPLTWMNTTVFLFCADCDRDLRKINNLDACMMGFGYALRSSFESSLYFLRETMRKHRVGIGVVGNALPRGGLWWFLPFGYAHVGVYSSNHTLQWCRVVCWKESKDPKSRKQLCRDRRSGSAYSWKCSANQKRKSKDLAQVFFLPTNYALIRGAGECDRVQEIV